MPEATPLLYTGMPRTWAIATGLPAVRHSVRLAIARAAWAHCLIVVSRVSRNFAGWGGAPEASPGPAPMQTPARDIADGREHCKRRLSDVRCCYAQTLDVTHATTHPHPEVLAEPHVHTQTQREIHVAVAAAESRDDHGVGVGSKGGLGILQVETPAQREANRDVVGVIAITHVGAQPDRERSIQREALTVLDNTGPEISPQEDASTAPDRHPIKGLVGQLRPATPNAEVVGPLPVGIEPLHCVGHSFARIR